MAADDGTASGVQRRVVCYVETFFFKGVEHFLRLDTFEGDLPTAAVQVCVAGEDEGFSSINTAGHRANVFARECPRRVEGDDSD